MAKPETMEQAFLDATPEPERGLQVLDKRQTYTAHPFGWGTLQLSGTTQFTAVTSGSTGVTTKSSAQKVVAGPSTISFPGLNENIDEIYFQLSADMKTDTTNSTVGIFWQWKASSGTTWQALTTHVTGDPTTYANKLHKGYGNPATSTGTYRLPIQLRLVGWNKTATGLQARVRASSYVQIKVKRQ